MRARVFHKSLNEIIDETVAEFHKYTSAIELEVRADITAEVWRQIYEKMDSRDIMQERSVTLSRKMAKQAGQRGSTYRMMKLYHDGKTDRGNIETSAMVKTGIMKYNLPKPHNAIKLAIASEHVIPPDDTQSKLADVIRFRHRYSAIWSKDWKLDLTLVWQLDRAAFGNLIQYRDEFLDSKYRDMLPIDRPQPSIGGYTYEVEIEYKGKPAELTPDDLRKQIDKITKYIAPGVIDQEHEIFVSSLSLLLDPARARKSLKEISNNPLIFTAAMYREVIAPSLAGEAIGGRPSSTPEQFYVCEKTDGQRAFIYIMLVASNTISDIIRRSKIITSTSLEDIEVIAKATKKVPLVVTSAIIDTEQYNDKYYAFDLLYLNNQSLINLPYRERLAQLQQVCQVVEIVVGGQKQKIICKTQTPTTIATFSEVAQDIMTAKHDYKIDGIIFTLAGSKYYDQESVYKWKPPSEQTIDFLVIDATPLQGIEPWKAKQGYKLYILFCSAAPNDLTQNNIDRIRNYTELLRGINYDERQFPIQFSPRTNPLAYMYYHPLDSTAVKLTDLHGHIIEFGYKMPKATDDKSNTKKVVAAGSDAKVGKSHLSATGGERAARDEKVVASGWIFHRTRPDRDITLRSGKSFGNYLKIACIIYDNYTMPLKLAHLTNYLEIPTHSTTLQSSTGTSAVVNAAPATNYFRETKAEFFIAPVKFNLFVKAMIMRQFERFDTVLDLACGNGQDMFIYSGYRVKHLIMLDRDAAALTELGKRREHLTDQGKYTYAPPPVTRAGLITPEIFPILADIGSLLEEIKTTRKTPQLAWPAKLPKQADAIVMNFAIHYFTDSTENIDALIELVDRYLRVGGIFLFTAFGGKQVLQLLGQTQQQWKIHEDSVLKYDIELVNPTSVAGVAAATPTLTPAGQAITVKLPFNSQPVQEYLVNQDYIIQRLRAKGYQLRQNASFANWLPRFETFYKGQELYKKLSNDDKKFCALYQYTSMIKLGTVIN